MHLPLAHAVYGTLTTLCCIAFVGLADIRDCADAMEASLLQHASLDGKADQIKQVRFASFHCLHGYARKTILAWPVVFHAQTIAHAQALRLLASVCNRPEFVGCTDCAGPGSGQMAAEGAARR